jgi:GNAT superfamily N-acetyltransferase
MSISKEPVYAPQETILSQIGSVKLVVKSEADAESIVLLKNAVYGTSGIRYQQTGQDQKLNQLSNPFFFHLYISDILQGFYCLDHRLVTYPFGNMNAFYGRYFAIHESAQGKGYGRFLKTSAVNYITETIHAPYLLYSFIEEKNTRSLSLSNQTNFASVAQLKTFVFRSLNPKADVRLKRASSAELPKIKSFLATYYADYGLVNFDKIGYQGNYFTLTVGEQVVGGVQANPVTWNFLQMPHWTGWFLMNILPRIPYLKKLFQPDYSFLALEGIYLATGQEGLFPILIESVLAFFNLNSALFEVDCQDKRLTAMLARMGLLSGYQADVTTHAMVKACGLSANQLAQLQVSPVYCSSFDFT